MFAQETGWLGFIERLLAIKPPDGDGGYRFDLSWIQSEIDLDLGVYEPNGLGGREIYWVYYETTANGVFGPDSYDSGQPFEQYFMNSAVHRGTFGVFASIWDWGVSATATLNVYDRNENLVHTWGPVVFDENSYDPELDMYGVAKFGEIVIE